MIVLACLVAAAAFIAGAQFVALGRKAALDEAYRRGWWDRFDEIQQRDKREGASSA